MFGVTNMLQTLNININMALFSECMYLIISLLNTNVVCVTKILHEISQKWQMYIYKKGRRNESKV